VTRSQVIWGAVLTAYGIGFVYFVNHVRRNDELLERIARGRGKSAFIRRLDPSERTAAEHTWVARDMLRFRNFLTWVALPVGIVFTIGAVLLLIYGFV
jgi:hypothetical protein